MTRANAKARRVPKSEESPEFIAFWKIWQPVMNANDGRGDARDQFFHHVEVFGADPLDLVDGAQWFVRNGGNAEFKLHAQTWLNKRAYEDGADKERAFQARIAEKTADRQNNVVSIKPQLPATHFSRQWEQRVKAEEA